MILPNTPSRTYDSMLSELVMLCRQRAHPALPNRPFRKAKRFGNVD